MNCVACSITVLFRNNDKEGNKQNMQDASSKFKKYYKTEIGRLYFRFLFRELGSSFSEFACDRAKKNPDLSQIL